jgi:catechol 2,3-dioxygenase-like lactoylglutathione lyase family enzyme
MPVRDVRTAASHYGDRFGFEAVHLSDDFAVVIRDEAMIQLWAAAGGSWTSRDGFAQNPVRSGAESFIAGTASCRIAASDIDALFGELKASGVLHPTVGAEPQSTDFGTREFATLDVDGNLLTFFRDLRR